LRLLRTKLVLVNKLPSKLELLSVKLQLCLEKLKRAELFLIPLTGPPARSMLSSPTLAMLLVKC